MVGPDEMLELPLCWPAADPNTASGSVESVPDAGVTTFALSGLVGEPWLTATSFVSESVLSS